MSSRAQDDLTASEPEGPATVAVTIDGRSFDAHPGELVIAAAERAGVYIPRFCWHPRMSPVGMCRMCLVEVDTGRGPTLQPSCMLAVAENMVVETASEVARQAQDGVLELLLVNHPLDCPVCDKGGECPLQDQTVAFGPGESRMVEERRHYEKPIAISELVTLDRERCILCDRCTRFADEVAGDRLISFVDRGNATQVNTFPDDPFASYFSGNTVQICPVGALTATPYRFKARPWDLEQVESTCTTCSVGCRMAVQSSGNQVVRHLGLDVDPVNWGWLCDKGRFAFEALNDDERLGAPLVADGAGGFVESTWSGALQRVVDGLGADDGSVAVLGGARLTNEGAYAWSKLARVVLGTDSVDAQLGDGLPADVVLGLPRATIDEACGADVVVVIAPDLKEELPVLHLRIRDAVTKHGLAVIELSSTDTSLTELAAVSLRHRPGEVAATVARLLDGTAGDAEAPALARARQLLDDATSVVCILGRASVAESADSVVHAADLLLASRPEVRFLPALRRGNVAGALDAGLAPGVLPGRVALAAGRDWYTRAWGELPSVPGLDAAGILAAAAEGRIQGLVLLGADPLADFPDRDLARRGVEGAGFVVAVDCFLTDSSRQADVILPAAAFAEQDGTTTNLEGRVSLVRQKVTAPGTARPDWSIAVELADRLGVDLGFDSVESVWAELERLSPVHAGITAARLGAIEALDGIVARFDPAAGTTDRPRPMVRAAATTAPTVPPVDAYALRLVSGRQLYDAGVAVAHSPHLRGLATGTTLRLHPHDLDGLGVAPGAEVRVTSRRASLVLVADADPGVPRGVAALSFNQPGPGAADLLDVSSPVTDVLVENP